MSFRIRMVGRTIISNNHEILALDYTQLYMCINYYMEFVKGVGVKIWHKKVKEMSIRTTTSRKLFNSTIYMPNKKETMQNISQNMDQ